MKMLYIIGYPRSGSTILGDYLNASGLFFHAGEIERIWQRASRGKYPLRNCSCGSSFDQCPVWAPIFEDLFTNRELQAYDSYLNSSSLRKIRDDFFGGRPVNDAAKKAYNEITRTLYQSIFNHTDRMLVDSSKELKYAKYLEEVHGYDIVYVHLIRDPRGVVHSRQRKLKKIDEQGKARVAYLNLLKDLWMWKKTKSDIRKFLQTRKHVEIQYEQFIADPVSTFNKIAQLAGLSLPNPGVLNNRFHNENHLVMGNVGRFNRGETELVKDEKWKKELRSRDIYLINTMLSILSERKTYQD